MRGSERNQPCPCGSGKKAKRCEHSVEPLKFKVVPVDRDAQDAQVRVAEIDTPRPRRMSPMMLAALVGMLDVPPGR